MMSSILRLSQRAEWAEGQPISDLMARALADPELISLAAGFVDQQTLPVEPTREALASLLCPRVICAGGTAIRYDPGFAAAAGSVAESNAGPRRLLRELSSDQIVITAGSNQLLHLVCESLLDPGDIVVCAAPTYLVFLGTLSNVGARSVGVAIDQHGMVPDALEHAACSSCVSKGNCRV